MSEVKLNFRKMVPEDADGVEIVEKACFDMPWSRKSFWQEASNDKAYYLLAIDENADDKIIGYTGMWVLFGEAQITNVAVMPEYRNLGIGRKMMKEIIQIAKSKGADAMTLEVRPSNDSALHLYKSLGFKSVGRRRGYYEDGEDAEIMWLMNL